MTTAIQRALRLGDTLEGLQTHYAIKHRRHATYPNLVLLKYDQIASPFAEQIVRECRGIILDEDNDWAVVSRSFDKFFNHGEGHAAAIDWSTARVQEKLDGSLCSIYHYDGRWHVQTTGTPDASGHVHGKPMSFAELFWQAWGERPLPRDCLSDVTFMFELTSPWNRVVVDHKETKLTLLGVRGRHSGAEFSPASASTILGDHFPIPRSFGLRSFSEIATTFQALDPLKTEGYVVCDAAFNRVKVKHPGYVALHHAIGSMSHRGLLEIARSGETTEVAAAFPDVAEQLNEMRSRLDAVANELDADYARIRDVPEQKAFALEAQKSRNSSALFLLRAGKVGSIREHLRNMHIDRLSDLLGYREAA